jgi:biopolymer transport protein ExbD
MTPIIDVVFLLIIFFLLVCQFIVAENFEVEVPDKIATAASNEAEADLTTTVTVMFAENGTVAYAVGAEIISGETTAGLSSAIAGAIDAQLRTLAIESRVVCLRIDKRICYRDSQYALAGISESTATDIKLAAMKERQM